jgi:type I restriction enzyme R subunit
MSRAQLISLLSSDAKLIDEREDMVAYINSLEAGKALNEKEIKEGYQDFKAEKQAKELADIARKHGLGTVSIERICRKHCKPDDF